MKDEIYGLNHVTYLYALYACIHVCICMLIYNKINFLLININVSHQIIRFVLLFLRNSSIITYLRNNYNISVIFMFIINYITALIIITYIYLIFLLSQY